MYTMVDIAYLIPGVGLSAEEQSRREDIANGLVRADVTVVESGGPGPTSIESAVEEYWCVTGTMRKIWEIREEYDAVVIGCYGDPGLRPVRELVDLPVIGPAEATIHTATQIGDRYGWLTILEETIPTSHELADRYGLGEECAAIYSVDASVEDIEHDSHELVDRMIEVGHRAVTEADADVLFPGCMSLAFMQVHEEVESELPVPFLDPATLALETAETWARHGISQSPSAYPNPRYEKLGALIGDSV